MIRKMRPPETCESPYFARRPDSHDDRGGDVEGYSHACLADQAVLGRDLDCTD